MEASTSSLSSSSKSPWTAQVASRPPRSTHTGKRKRSASPSPSYRPRDDSDNTDSSGSSAERTSGSTHSASRSTSTANLGTGTIENPAKRVRFDSTNENLYPIFPGGGKPLGDANAIARIHDSPHSSDMDEGDTDSFDQIFDNDVIRRLDFSEMSLAASKDKAPLPLEEAGLPIIDNDPSNPFLATPSNTRTFSPPEARNTLAQESPTSTPCPSRNTPMASPLSSANLSETLAILSRFGDILPSLATTVPDLIKRINTLERKRNADAMSIEWKVKRIKELNALGEEQKEEIERLKEENMRLRKKKNGERSG